MANFSPIRKRAIQPAQPQEGIVLRLRRVFLRRFPVKLDAQTWPRRREQIAILPFGLHGDHIGENGPSLARLFLHAEIGRGEVQL